MQFRSTAFSSGKEIPEQYTCDGEDISPPFFWGDPPPGTQSFVIILDNPDATTERGWVHWILFNIPGEERSLPEAVPPIPELEDGSLHGVNSEEWLRYVGPCPPFTQRYSFRLYALDTLLDLAAGANKEEIKQAMEGHILAQGELMGKYKRQD
ncbi:MAG: YbhB/YbcL family Raf kinase inhibitor-like protein [Anaerolineales bacterium]|nr:YbhB/YbcL family Raf kinase inhibitor-like protein [Anaerolineales bacterium]